MIDDNEPMLVVDSLTNLGLPALWKQVQHHRHRVHIFQVQLVDPLKVVEVEVECADELEVRLRRGVLGHVVWRHGALGQAAAGEHLHVAVRVGLRRLAVLAHLLVPHHHGLREKVTVHYIEWK